MVSNIDIQLGNTDNAIKIAVAPTFKMKYRTTIKSRLGKYFIEWYMQYYMNEAEYPLIEIYNGHMELKYYEIQWYYNLKKYVQNMENNKSCKCGQITWNENINLWQHKLREVSDPLCLPLCDDSKQQFMQEMKGMLHTARGIYIKQIGIHPAIVARRVLAGL